MDKDTALLLSTDNCGVHIWDIHNEKWSQFLCRLTKDEVLEIEKKHIEKDWLYRTAPYSLFEKVVSVLQFADYIVTSDTSIFKQIYDCYYGEKCNFTIGDKVHQIVKSNEII